MQVADRENQSINIIVFHGLKNLVYYDSLHTQKNREGRNRLYYMDLYVQITTFRFSMLPRLYVAVPCLIMSIQTLWMKMWKP